MDRDHIALQIRGKRLSLKVSSRLSTLNQALNEEQVAYAACAAVAVVAVAAATLSAPPPPPPHNNTCYDHGCDFFERERVRQRQAEQDRADCCLLCMLPVLLLLLLVASLQHGFRPGQLP